jgi:hypothetical protein
MTDTRCFLCEPDPKLLIHDGRSMRLIAGLGPLVPGYTVLASKKHSRSLADLADESPEAIEELRDIRRRMTAVYGAAMITEHGRVPVCRDDNDEHEQHCHHAHCLVFPTAVDILPNAESYFGRVETRNSLAAALALARGAENYFLVSADDRRYSVFSEPLSAPRQLARYLVAFATNQPGLADWRVQPREAEAKAMAEELRKIFGDTA